MVQCQDSHTQQGDKHLTQHGDASPRVGAGGDDEARGAFACVSCRQRFELSPPHCLSGASNRDPLSWDTISGPSLPFLSELVTAHPPHKPLRLLPCCGAVGATWTLGSVDGVG